MPTGKQENTMYNIQSFHFPMNSNAVQNAETDVLLILCCIDCKYSTTLHSPVNLQQSNKIGIHFYAWNNHTVGV